MAGYAGYLLSGCGNFFRFNRLSRVKHSIYMRFRTQAADVQHARFTSIDPAGWTRDREQKFWLEVRHSHSDSLSRKTSWNCTTLNSLNFQTDCGVLHWHNCEATDSS